MKIITLKGATLSITFNVKDLPLCKHLQTLLEGNIRIKQKNNACVLSFQKRETLLKLVKMMSGNLRTPKYFKFNELINFLNDKLNLNLPHTTIDKTTPLYSNSWLAGFIEADGSFSIRYTTNGKKFRIACTLRIEQRMKDPYSNLSYESLFLQIADFLNCNLKTSNHNTDKTYYLLNANSRKSIKIILNYFSKFNLFGSKYLDYMDWNIVANLLISYKAYLPENKIKILNIKSGLNNLRVNFNWDHLKNLH